MTIGELPSAQEEPLAKAPRKTTLLARIGDWVWRGSALSNVRAAMPEPGERAVRFAERARASSELAKNMLASDEPGEAGSESNACEAYRQSSYWALCALLARVEPTLQPHDSERIWGALDEALLAQAASDETRIDGLRNALRTGSFVYFAELPPEEQSALVAELNRLAQALLAKLAERSAALDAVYLQRAWRLLLLALLTLGLALSPALVKKAIEARSELSRGKAWHTSSRYAGGCTSPEQDCADNTGYFFHTNLDATPWVEFDLGKNQKISKVRVDNRSDCCTDRADPLVIEVSTDHKNWRVVARRSGEFTTWEVALNPVNARYLRVRLMKESYLHLERVRIY